jgi:hypothetical protein
LTRAPGAFQARLLDRLAIACTECRRHPRRGELWRLYFIDLGEVAIRCPECAEREFGDPQQYAASASQAELRAA